MPIDSSRSIGAGTPDASHSSRRSRKPSEPGARVLRRLRHWRKRHHPDDPGGLEPGCSLEELRHVEWRRPELRGLVGDLHLNQEFRRGPCLDGCEGDLLEQLDAVDRLDRGERRRGFSSLVRLQVTEEMPPDLRFRSTLDLLEGFLNAVFTKITLAGGVRFADQVHRKRLGDRDELYGGRVTSD